MIKRLHGIKRGILCAICALVLLGLQGCGKGKALAPIGSSGGFEAEVTGQLRGVEMQAKVSVSAEKDGLRTLSVTYTLPAALNGLTVTAQTDADGTPVGEISLLLSRADPPLSITRDGELFAGLLTPAAALIPRKGYESIQQTKTETQLKYPNGMLLTLDPSGKPREAQSDFYQLRVIFWSNASPTA